MLVDEAYADFSGESAQGLIRRYDNLLIVRTLSKAYALAGLRVGYAIGQPGLIEALATVKDSFNSYPLDQLAIAGAIAAVEDQAYLKKTLAAIVDTRDHFAREIHALGFEALDSGTNFVFARHPKLAGVKLFEKLRERKILVRHFNRPPIEDYLRISIGTPAQMQTVTEALRDILAQG